MKRISYSHSVKTRSWCMNLISRRRYAHISLEIRLIEQIFLVACCSRHLSRKHFSDADADFFFFSKVVLLS